MDSLPIEERLELALTHFVTEMVAHQIPHSDHAPVAQRVLDAHCVNEDDREELEAKFYTRIPRSTRMVPERQMPGRVIHLNRPRIISHVRLTDSVTDRALSSGLIAERPVCKPLELPDPTGRNDTGSLP